MAFAHAIRLADAAARTCRFGVYNTPGTHRPGCQKPVTHVTEYQYVTGRAGRVTTSRKGRCHEHAERFAAKYGCPMPGENT